MDRLKEMASQGPSPSLPFWAPAEPLSASYDIDVCLDPREDAIRGTGRIRLVNRSALPLGHLALCPGTVREGSFRLECEQQELRLTPHESVARAPVPIRVGLSRPLGPGAALELRVTFEGRLPGRMYGAWMLQDWHPRLWWGYPTCDDFAVRIDVPSGYRVVASGRTGSDPKCWSARAARSFGIVLRDDAEAAQRQAGEVCLRSLFTPAGSECAAILLETAVDVVDFYRAECGFYPQPFLSIVPGAEHPMGGFPFATGIVSIHGQERFDGRSRDHWRWITAHEIGHQYFGEYVLEGDEPGWMWIALGISMDRDYARARGLDRQLHRVFLDRYLQGMRDGFDTTVARPPEQLAGLPFDHNNIVIHGKGFAIISSLETVIGPEVFRRVRARCLAEFHGRRLGAHAFQGICQEEAGQDLEWFFSQWVRSNRYPGYRLAAVEQTEEEEDAHAATVRVERIGTLAMPIPVEARFADGSVQRRVTDRLLDTCELTFAGAAPVREVVLDPDGSLPLLDAAVTPIEPVDEALHREIARMPWTGAGEKARQLFTWAHACGLHSAPLWAKLGLALYDGAHYAEGLDAFHQAGEQSPDDTSRIGCWIWQGHLLDLLGRRGEALTWYQKAQEAGFSGSIYHDQYGIVLNAGWIEERLRVPFQRVRT